MSVAELESPRSCSRRRRRALARAWYRLRRNPGAIVGVVFVLIFVLVAIFAPLIAPDDPPEQISTSSPNGCCPGPSAQHWLGIDTLGRDEFSRIVYGARYSLLVGIVAVSVGLSIGLVLGAIAGFSAAGSTRSSCA